MPAAHYESSSYIERYTATVYPSTGIYTAVDIPSKVRRVDNTGMEYGANIKRLRSSRNWTQAHLAMLVGVEQPTVGRWEKNQRTPELGDWERLADAFGISLSDIFQMDTIEPIGPKLYLKGEVAAGLWREAIEWPHDDWSTFTGRADVSARTEHRFGLRIVGDSMDEIYPHGTIVECVTLFGRTEAAPGKRVVVVRQRDDHQYEATVKELVELDGVWWLKPRSRNPAHQAYRLDQNEPGIIETRITAVVVASIRPE